MTRSITDAIASSAALDVERKEAESLLRVATSAAKACEHFGINTLGLWLQIAETRAVVERLGR